MHRRLLLPLLLSLALMATSCHLTGGSWPSPVNIEGNPVASQRDARVWARDNGAPSWYRDLVRIYWEVARARGVRPDVAFAQSAKETGFGRFGTVVTRGFKNPCGLKTTEGGANDDPDAHARFDSWRQGIIACVDHLALYAGVAGYPRANSHDPRHFSSIKGTATTVQALGGRWAPARDYGRSIVDGYLVHMIFGG